MGSSQRVRATVITDAGGAERTGRGKVAILAPLHAGATIAANAVREYRTASAVSDDHGDSSLLYTGAKFALYRAPSVLMVGVAQKTGSPYTEVIAGTGVSGTISVGDAAKGPIYEITTAKVDSVAIAGTIRYCSPDVDPAGETVAAGDVLVNTYTRKYKFGTAPVTNAEFTWKSYDYAAAFKMLDVNSYEFLVHAGIPLNNQYAGVHKEFITHAAANNKIVLTAFESGVAPADIAALATAMRDANGTLRIHADFYGASEDAACAYAGHIASFPVNGTSAAQPAPGNLTRGLDDYYAFEDYGDAESPTSGTFGELGVVAVTRDPFGGTEMTSDRLATAGTAYFRDLSTKRIVRDAHVGFVNALDDLRRAGPTTVPFSGSGRIAILTKLKEEADERSSAPNEFIEPVPIEAITVPPADTLTTTQRKTRVWSGMQIPIVPIGQAEAFVIEIAARF